MLACARASVSGERTCAAGVATIAISGDDGLPGRAYRPRARRTTTVRSPSGRAGAVRPAWICADSRTTLAGPNSNRGNATTRPEKSLALSPRTPDVMCGWRAMGCVAARAFKLLSPAVTTAVTSFFAIRRGFQKVRLGSSKETRKNQGSRTLDRSIPIRSNRVERHSSGGRFGPLQNSHHRRNMKTVGDPGQTNYTATAALHDHATAPGLFLLLLSRLFRLRRQLR